VDRRELIGILHEAIELLRRPGNNFDWSSWENADDAIAEFNELITSLESGRTPRRTKVRVLFAPTGPLQEASMSSGWSCDFLALAERFDSVESRLYGSVGDGDNEKVWMQMKPYHLWRLPIGVTAVVLAIVVFRATGWSVVGMAFISFVWVVTVLVVVGVWALILRLDRSSTLSSFLMFCWTLVTMAAAIVLLGSIAVLIMLARSGVLEYGLPPCGPFGSR
jgi:hypothetical protein